MEMRELGTSGIKVSVICLGTMTWGEQNTEKEAHEQLDYALAHNVNFIDTAEMYPVPPMGETQGRTEQYIGTWIAARKNRDKFILATKVVGRSQNFQYLGRGETRLNKKQITQALENSLKRLQTDYVDLYQLHWPDRSTNYFGQLGYTHQQNEEHIDLQETLDALQGLIKAGKIRQVGLSNETPWGVTRALHLAENKKLPRVQSIQNPYSLLNRSYEIGLAEISIRSKCGLLAYSPLAFGVLSGKYLDGQKPAGARLTLYSRFSRYNGVAAEGVTASYVGLAREHSLDPAQMALAYVNSRPFVTSNIIGATTMEQLASNIASHEIKLSKDVLAGIEAIHNRHANPCP